MRPTVQSTRTALPRRARNTRVSLALDDLIDRYDLNNRAEGKSAKTVESYADILRSFSSYTKTTHHNPNIHSSFVELLPSLCACFSQVDSWQIVR